MAIMRRRDVERIKCCKPLAAEQSGHSREHAELVFHTRTEMVCRIKPLFAGAKGNLRANAVNLHFSGKAQIKQSGLAL